MLTERDYWRARQDALAALNPSPPAAGPDLWRAEQTALLRRMRDYGKTERVRDGAGLWWHVTRLDDLTWVASRPGRSAHGGAADVVAQMEDTSHV
jgi:hypothetical protein